MIYLIGGSARCGKSTLARQIRANFDGQVISHDSVMRAIRAVTTPESEPGIFDKIVNPLSRDDPLAKRIERLRERDQVERLIYIRDNATEGNWMADRQYTDDYMRTWAAFNIARSHKIKDECRKYGYMCFDIADDGMDRAEIGARTVLFR